MLAKCTSFLKISGKFVCNFFAILLTSVLPYLAMVKQSKIKTCHIDLWCMTLKLNRVLDVVKIHVRANVIKLCSAVHEFSWQQKNGETKNLATTLQTILSSLPRAVRGVYTIQQTSSKRPAIRVYFEYICWTFAGSCKHSINVEPINQNANHISGCMQHVVDDTVE